MQSLHIKLIIFSKEKIFRTFWYVICNIKVPVLVNTLGATSIWCLRTFC
jgi:hypothetical protein